ncbi:uncharacterized protein LOC135211295 [Macrobrachium nipponense]|uniref:uncharacterized protein LOC135211295 n=1 Tax=Macrobrachium nipponense TaxID=159736 RepID=UPI0030C7D465
MKRLILAKNRPEIDPWGFLFPLSPTVWGSLILSLIIVWLVTILLEFATEKRMGYSGAFGHLFSDVSVFVQQGISLNLDLGWQKMIAYSWLILVTVVAWSYAGNLMSQLAVRYVPQSVKTVQDMVDNPKLTLIQLNNTALTDYLATVKSGVFREMALMWDKGRMKYLEDAEFPHALDTLVRQGDHVILTTDVTAEMYMADLFTRTGQCDFYMAQEEFLPLALGIITRKNSLLMPAINARFIPSLMFGDSEQVPEWEYGEEHEYSSLLARTLETRDGLYESFKERWLSEYFKQEENISELETDEIPDTGTSLPSEISTRPTRSTALASRNLISLAREDPLSPNCQQDNREPEAAAASSSSSSSSSSPSSCLACRCQEPL